MISPQRTQLAALCGDAEAAAKLEKPPNPRLSWLDWTQKFTELADHETQKIAAVVTSRAVYLFWLECAADSSDLRFVDHFGGTGLSALYQATAICCHAPEALPRITAASGHLRAVRQKFEREGGTLWSAVIEQLHKAGAVVASPQPQALLELLRDSAALIGAHDLNEALDDALAPWLLEREDPPFLGLYGPDAQIRLEDLVCPEEAGLRRVRGIYWETLRNMIVGGFADRESTHNRSPAIKDFLAFMERFPNEVLAHGFYKRELVMEGVTVLKSSEGDLTEGLREGFFELCDAADENGETDWVLYSWWD